MTSALELQDLDLDPIAIDYADKRLRLVKELHRWEANKHYLLPIVKALLKLQVESRWEVDGLNISFSGDAVRLGEVFGILRHAGYAFQSARPKSGDTTWSAWWRSGDKVPIWTYFASSVCKRVKVGTKMVEQDVYETQCDSIEVPQLENENVSATPF